MRRDTKMKTVIMKHHSENRYKLKNMVTYNCIDCLIFKTQQELT